MIKCFILLVSLIVSYGAMSEAGAIYSAGQVKIMKPTAFFSQSGVKLITNDSDDPTAVAKDAPAGSLYFRSGTGEVYVKQDSGSSTNWSLAPLSLGPLTANRAVVTDASGNLSVALTTDTEIGYVNGVTSAIQTQLDSKVAGPASSTDNAIARYDGITGKLSQDSLVIIDDLGAVTGITDLTVDNLNINGNTISSTSGNIILTPTANVQISTLGAGVLQTNGSGLISAGTVSLTSDVAGVLPIANGGTNSSTALNNDRIMVSSGGAVVEASALTNGQLLIGSTGVAPVAAAITGTADQVNVANGAGSITLSTPQSIATTSSPTFANVLNTGISGAAGSVPYTAADGSLAIHSGLTYSNIGSGVLTLDTLDVSTLFSTGGAISVSSGIGFAFADLPDTWIPYSNSGTLEWNSAFTWDYNTNKLGISGEAQIDNTNINGNTVSTTSATPLILSGSSGIVETIAGSAFRINNVSLGGILTTDISTKNTETKVLTDGQLLIGSSSAEPVAATLTAVANETVMTAGAGSLTVGFPNDKELATNFFDIGHFENNSVGLAHYADAAGLRPVDGNLGTISNNFTSAITTTSGEVLNGSYSLKLSKNANNVQGEGIANGFNIDPALQGNTVQISFNYSTIGSYLDNDLTDMTEFTDMIVYVYDIDNAKLIEPIGMEIPAGTNREHYAFFQASPPNGGTPVTNYRLIFHISSDNPLAYDVVVDNIRISEPSKGQVTPVTNTFDCTPQTTSITSGTFTHLESKCSIVGDRMTVESSYQSTAAVTGSLTLSSAQLLPAGYEIDTAKIDSSVANTNGAWFAFDASAATTANDFTGVAMMLTNGTIRFYTSTNDSVDADAPFTWASGDYFSFRVTVPIKGHSGNASVNEIRSQKVVNFRATRVTDQTISSASATKIEFNSIARDSVSGWDSGNYRYYIQESGDYSVNVSITTNDITATDSYFGRLYVNGSLVDSVAEQIQVTNTNFTMNLPYNAYFNKGDYIEVFSDTSADTSYRVMSVGTSLNIHKIQSPHANAPMDKIRAVYSSAAGQSIPNTTTTIVDLGTKEVDTHGAVTTGASWKFTAPRAGYANITASVGTNFLGWTIGERFQLFIYKNGSEYRRNDAEIITSDSSGANYSWHSNITSFSIPMEAGDYLDIRVYQTSGGAVSLNATATEVKASIEMD